MSYCISLEIESGNPFNLLSRLMNLGFKVHKVNKMVDSWTTITDIDELTTLSAELDAHHDEYLLKAILNGTGYPSQYIFAMIYLCKGPKKLHFSYEEE